MEDKRHQSTEAVSKIYFWDKVKFTFVPKLENLYENSTIFDLINLIGLNDDLMSIVYSKEEQETESSKNWVVDIFSEAFASGPEARIRQRFFQLLSVPLSTFVSTNERTEIIKELNQDFVPFQLEFGVKIQITRTTIDKKA